LKILTSSSFYSFNLFITYIPELVGTWKNGMDFHWVWEEDLMSMRNICWLTLSAAIGNLRVSMIWKLIHSYPLRCSKIHFLIFSDYHMILGQPGKMNRMYYFCFWFHILQCSTWHCWGRWLRWLVSLRTLQRIHIRSSMLMWFLYVFPSCIFHLGCILLLLVHVLYGMQAHCFQ
jgi:hypothetical protein